MARFRVLLVMVTVIAALICAVNMAAIWWPMGVAAYIAPIALVDRALTWARHD